MKREQKQHINDVIRIAESISNQMDILMTMKKNEMDKCSIAFEALSGPQPKSHKK